MTVVAFDGKTLAADKMVGPHYTLSKIWRFSDGTLFSGCGYYDQVVEVADWISKGRKAADKPILPEDQASTFVLVDSDGKGFWMTWPYLRPIQFTEPFWAVGSGAEYALGAMAAGAAAKKAVEIACKYDLNCGRGVSYLKVGAKGK